MWLLAGPVKCNWPGVTLWSVFQYPVTYYVIGKKFKGLYLNKTHIDGYIATYIAIVCYVIKFACHYNYIT